VEKTVAGAAKQESSSTATRDCETAEAVGRRTAKLLEESTSGTAKTSAAGKTRTRKKDESAARRRTELVEATGRRSAEKKTTAA